MWELVFRVLAFAALMAAIVYAGFQCARYNREYPDNDSEGDDDDV